MKKTINEECPSCSTEGGTADDSILEACYSLSHWPIQIKLVSTVAPFPDGADLLVAADCTAFAVHDFHDSFLKDNKLLIGCPKLDDAQYYMEKFTEIFSNIPLKSISCLRMEVPCCGGLTAVLREALQRSGKEIPFKEMVINVKGDLLGKKTIIE